MIKFKEKLRELREEKKLSQSQLAKNISVSQRSISNWETGSREPDFKTLELLAKFFEVSINELLDLED